MIEQSMVTGARLWRRVAGNGTRLERAIKRRYRSAVRVERGRQSVLYSNQHAVVVQSRHGPEPRAGIFMKGGCDLPSLFLAGPMIAQSIQRGSVAVVRPPDAVGSSQTSQLLQTLEGVSPEIVAETCRRLEIRPSYFKPVLFQDGFEVGNLEHLGRFPMSVVVLSIGSDLTRSLHQHREHGFLVDIGGWWLNQSLDKAIKDTDTIKWFKTNFEPVGRIGLDQFVANTERLIGEIRSKVGAHVIVLNTLVVEPSDPTHNYQLHNPSHGTRRREFNLALAELSRDHGFHVLDVDRILKNHGVSEQVDFAHFPVEGKLPVAAEGFRILRDLEVV